MVDVVDVVESPREPFVCLSLSPVVSSSASSSSWEAETRERDKVPSQEV